MSCDGDIQREFNSTYRCRFTFNTTYHPACDLIACVNPQSMGTYCIVRKTADNGQTYNLSMTLYRKSPTTEAIRTAEETRQQCVLGANNGLIIGRSAFNNGELYAYDLSCPSCLASNRYNPLAFETGTKVKCATCECSFSLDNNGFAVSGETKERLQRYHATFNGTILVVSN